MAALDQAVSANFSVRETPLYAIVNAQVLVSSGKLDDARKVLETAMQLPGVRSALKPEQRAAVQARAGRRVVEPTLHERATIYLLLADVLGRLSKLPDAPEAKKYISDAMREFEGTSEEVRGGWGVQGEFKGAAEVKRGGGMGGQASRSGQERNTARCLEQA